MQDHIGQNGARQNATPKVEFRGRIYDSIVDTIGATPLVRLSRLAAAHGVHAELIGKCEFFNPLASVKDRIGVAMVDAAERDGRIRPGTVLVEPSSGNTGIALAFVCAARGLTLIITMPESASEERRKMMRLLGAQIELTPAALGMRGAIGRAEELVATLPDAVMLQQFDNPANPAAHERTTAEEIWRDTGGQFDAIVGGVGTGGTMSGLARTLKPRLPGLRVIGVEPAASPVLSGGVPGPHKLQGIGAGFVPRNLDAGALDEVILVKDEPAFQLAREAARTEGVAVGISGGAALVAALQVAGRPGMDGRRVIVILPSFAERYLSTPLFEGF